MYYFMTCSIISVGHFDLVISEVLVILVMCFFAHFAPSGNSPGSSHYGQLTITITAYDNTTGRS